MIRVFDLKSKFILKEAINSDLGVYMVRWDYRPFLELEDPELEDSALVDTDYATWVLERYYHDPTLDEVKSTILKWCNVEYNKSGFYIDGNKCTLSESDIAALRINCEYNTSSTIVIPCSNTSLEFDTDVALLILLRLNDYYEGCKKVKETLIALVKTADSLEAIGEIDFNPTFPDDINLESSSITVEDDSKELEKIQQAVEFSTMIINTLSLTDSLSLSVKYLYPEFDDIIGQELAVGYKTLDEDSLYKVIQAHTAQADWRPSTTPSLFTEISESHSGTIDDPIPYNNNMELELGKYYIQNEQVYLCTRSTGQPIYNDLKDLVNIYVVEIYND